MLLNNCFFSELLAKMVYYVVSTINFIYVTIIVLKYLDSKSSNYINSFILYFYITRVILIKSSGRNFKVLRLNINFIVFFITSYHQFSTLNIMLQRFFFIGAHIFLLTVIAIDTCTTYQLFYNNKDRRQ